MARLRRGKTRIKDIAPRQCTETGYPGYPYFKKPAGWKPAQEIRLEKLIAKYRAERQQGKAWGLMDVIFIFYRNNMTLSETATILATDESDISFCLDEIRQNAR